MSEKSSEKSSEVSRRKFGKVAIGAGAVVVATAAAYYYAKMLPGVTPTVTTSAPTTGTTVVASTTIVTTPPPTLYYGTTSDAASLDPAIGWEFTSQNLIYNVYDRLLTHDIEKLKLGVYELAPSIAKNWSLADDKVTYTFGIRDDVYFANGDKLVADDVKWSIERHIGLQGPNSYLLAGPISQVKAPDAETVQIILKDVDVSFLQIIACFGSILNRRLVEEHTVADDNGTAWLQENSAGSGPFVLTGWKRKERIELARNERYWGQPKPSVGKIVIRDIAEPTNQKLALERGDIDLADGMLLEQVNSFRGNPEFQVLGLPINMTIYMAINIAGPLKDLRVRKAIAYSINYDEIVSELLRGQGEVVQSMVVPGYFGYDTDLAHYYNFDPEKAKTLLAEAGYPNGIELEMVHPPGGWGGIVYATVSTKIQSDLAKAGIKTNLRQLEWSTLYDLYRGGKLEGLIAPMPSGWSYPDPDEAVSWIMVSLAEDRVRFQQPDEIKELATKQKTLTDPAERKSALRELQEVQLRDELFFLGLYVPKMTVVAKSGIAIVGSPMAQGMLWNCFAKS